VNSIKNFKENNEQKCITEVSKNRSTSGSPEGKTPDSLEEQQVYQKVLSAGKHI
jgi:hypothetical protein